ncbi:unnamed protein product [Adineta steineri]|uniref:Uncharacterized protein n=1 Tax=Adineta steineri TaxID=433720 RepID=A0A815KHT1_9BILA|nr:unnamed protein product [Adineta steineri]CAF1390010.1 unnamed protein product [Adineta steineri]
MSREEEEAKAPIKSSIINYVENFIDKRNRELRASTGDESDTSATHEVNRDSIVINTGDNEYRHDKFKNDRSSSTDIDADDLNLDSDPIIETQEGGAQVYKQQVYLRQYQPPTPEPVDIQVQEVFVKPQVQRPPIHVHVGLSKNRDTQRTPSPILIKTAPPQAPPPSSEEPIIYNKYVPVDFKQPPQQIIIHRHADLPPKPRPIVVEQWLPNKPAPKRITYHHVNPEDYVQSETHRLRNRFIEYTKPHTTIEVEIVRLPVIKLRPEEYHNRSPELTKIDEVRSMTQDPNTLNWRI